MPDRRNLKSLDRLDAPDLWPEIEGREPGRPVSLAPSPLRRVGTALLALAIAAGAITLAVVAFGGGKGSAPVATSPFAPETTSAVPRPENGDALVYARPGPDETRQLTSQDGPPFTYDPDSEPAWSPDGQWIAFVRGIASFGPGGLETGRTYGIWVVRPDGSDMHAVTTTKSETVYPMTPAWSPDGRSIAYVVVDRGRTEVHAIEADGTGDRTGVSFSCPDADTACGPARGSLSWSPDGTSLLFGIEETVQAPADSYVLPSGTYVVNANGSALHQVGASLGDSRPVGWAPAAPEPTAGS